ncbi:hypothetical protein OIDMADRAFT_123386 [Oidiodendron maius Zn]|uniref:BSD domain-containing protein n=1 Tax=Oidiodendron maius (strain Zn) TaxID=913774 RepID=A0A0C3DH39_OIDMZ|nr:hypothetical protein OIDMADRAFT_123386 [Oidiodendron maius Zn]
MDLAYDHIQEEALKQEAIEKGEQKNPESTLNDDFQEAYRAISSSPWGAKLGGFFGSVVKQGESVYKEAQQELTAVSEEATKGFEDLRSSIIKRTRGLSQPQAVAEKSATDEEAACEEKEAPTEDALEASEGVLARLRAEAAKRLKEIEKAEDAADEALLKFGTNIRNFLRDAVSIAAPSDDQQGSTVLFESKDAHGKRVIHTTRFDAQLHAIHSSLDSFTKDPDSEEFKSWAEKFNAESKTDDISKDLESFPELRASMEKVVPDRVSYLDFWKRYYFLRHSVETAEARRRDLLKGAAAETEEEVGWDEDSDDDTSKAKAVPGRSTSSASSTTLHPSSQSAGHSSLKPSEPRKSDEKSQADSDASYDVVNAASGAPSQAPASPRESRKGEDSEEEDWE